MLEHLLRPFSYLTIEHRLKWQIDWLIPLVLAAMTVTVLLAAGGLASVSAFGESGLVARIVAFVQNLPGFYIAALAAIATFNKPDIDRHMPEPAPSIEIPVQGKSVAIKLTRRRFLCAMFAFLTAEAIVVILLGIAGLSLATAAKLILPTALHAAVKYGFLFVFVAVFWQMLVASFWGLYYLGERLHQPDQTPSG